jgi:hypothetical protein
MTMDPLSIELGAAGRHLVAGDHVCAVFVGAAQRDAVLLPYLRAGLQSGHKVVAAVDPTSMSSVKHALGAADGDVDDGSQLELGNADDAYLPRGRFSAEDTIDYWDGLVRPAIRGGGYRFARLLGEMSPQMRGRRAEVLRYEAELNRFAPRYPQAILCLYDLARFGGGLLGDLMQTHPKLLIHGVYLDNPQYQDPDHYLAVSNPDAAVEAALSGWREAVAMLERRELETRARRRAERLVEHRFQRYQVARLALDRRRESEG